MSFSPTQAALEGFRLVGRRPVSFLAWSLLIGVTTGAFLTGFIWAFGDVSALIAAKAPTLEDFLSTAGRFLLLWLAGLVGMLLIFAVLIAAVYRAVLKPSRRAFAYLRLGADELRLIALQLLVMLIQCLCGFGATVVIIAVAASSLLLVAKILIGVLVGFTALAVMVFAWVRLSLAGPLIVAQGRLDLSGAWALTRGRFWSLLGMGVVTIALAMAVSMAAQMCLQPFFMVAMPHFAGAPGWGDTTQVDPWSYVRDNPAIFAALGVLAMLAMALQLVVQATPFAAAYRDLSEPG